MDQEYIDKPLPNPTGVVSDHLEKEKHRALPTPPTKSASPQNNNSPAKRIVSPRRGPLPVLPQNDAQGSPFRRRRREELQSPTTSNGSHPKQSPISPRNNTLLQANPAKPTANAVNSASKATHATSTQISGSSSSSTFSPSTKTVRIENLKFEEIKAIGDVPCARYNHIGVFITNNDFLVFGGAAGGTQNEPVPCDNNVYLLNIVESSWKKIIAKEQWPTCLEYASATVDANGDMFVFGGRDVRNPTMMNNDLWRFDSKQHTFTKVLNEQNVSKPCARAGHVLTSINNRSILILNGGIDENGRLLNDTWKFECSTLSWVKLSGTLAPSGRFNHSIATINNIAIVFGGVGGRYFVPRGDLWALKNESWDMLDNCADPADRQGHVMIALNNAQIFIVGGAGDGGAENDAYLFDIDNNQFSSISNIPSINCDVGMAGDSSTSNGAVLFGGGAPIGDEKAKPSDRLWRIVC